MAFLAFAVGAASDAGAAPAGRTQALFFDALFTHAQTSGPGPTHVHTVHRHVANIRNKLGRGSRTAAVAEAARLGLL